MELRHWTELALAINTYADHDYDCPSNSRHGAQTCGCGLYQLQKVLLNEAEKVDTAEKFRASDTRDNQGETP